MYNKILIASALNQGFSDRALAAAKLLVSENGKIIVAHVIEPVNNVVQSFVSKDVESKAYEKIKDLMAERCHDEAVESEILHGQAGREISKYANKIEADCIIIGSHKPGLEDFFLGSTSARVVRYSKCSVHVLR
ncbi:universal stress protein [Cocleimonas flava]|uniref:Nucleotide-binding universal stress UspA family protein n=1 Tax=Cocleimonas flava TaxID=634765 RepID=A0A4R1F4C6_9GAMM|nr:MULTISPECIES: universal stress protein [Cocleimonas]MEB8431458.1 universal stress protein [Cocleimonas sp. KMM 6892]MEC4713770.1 universal stress protein [Cocleimonas sp. KMM 6895]MEC4743101.1 universal stress protein [Cocleimonas sp. KMM 6896]TCJ89137.1 nucleotide-binding universal stress UspA family protein [Cocleimonas flava]